VPCRKVAIRINAVVLVCAARWSDGVNYSQIILTLNRRGGTIGERVVNHSLTPAPTSVTHPTTSKTIVEVRDPIIFPWIEGQRREELKSSQPFSLSLKPNRMHKIPPVKRINPAKSNSATCSRKDFPARGLRLRKKNNTRPATPPVGLKSSLMLDFWQESYLLTN